MNQQQALLLIKYINRAIPIVPITAEDWEQLKPALQIVDAIASGRTTFEEKKEETVTTAEPPKKPHIV